MRTPLTQLEEDLFPMVCNDKTPDDIKSLISYYKSFEEAQLKKMYELGVRAGKDSIELGEVNKNSDEVFATLYA